MLTNNIKVRYKLFFWIALTWTFFSSCGTRKLDLAYLQTPSIRLKLRSDKTFEYTYYVMGGSKSDSKWLFFVGKYIPIEKNVYRLNPTIFDSNNIDIETHYPTSNQTVDGYHLTITTDIYTDKPKEFKIKIHDGMSEWIFNGLKVDTVIRNFSTKSISIEIDLPDYFINATPFPTYNKIITKQIDLDRKKNILIHVPITHNYFYYYNSNGFVIKDLGHYYKLNNETKKIQKAVEVN